LRIRNWTVHFCLAWHYAPGQGPVAKPSAAAALAYLILAWFMPGQWFERAKNGSHPLVGHSSFVHLGGCLRSCALLCRSSVATCNSEKLQDPSSCPGFLIFHFWICSCELFASAAFSLLQGTGTVYCPYLQIELATRFYVHAPNGLSRSFWSIFLPLPK
jgi:hypothetical protein